MMSSAKKTRARMRDSDQGTFPQPAELVTPRRSSRNRQSAGNKVQPPKATPKATPTPRSNRAARTSLTSGHVTKTPSVDSTQNLRSSRLRNSCLDNVNSPVSRSPTPQKRRSANVVNKNEVELLTAKESSKQRRGSKRSSKGNSESSENSSAEKKLRTSVGKRKSSRSQDSDEQRVPEKVIIVDHSENNDIGCTAVATENLDKSATESFKEESSAELSERVSVGARKLSQSQDADEPQVSENVTIDHRENTEIECTATAMEIVDKSGADEPKVSEKVTGDHRENTENECTTTTTEIVDKSGADEPKVSEKVSSDHWENTEIECTATEIVDKSGAESCAESQGDRRDSENVQVVMTTSGKEEHCSENIQEQRELEERNASLQSVSKVEEERTNPMDALVRELAEAQATQEMEDVAHEKNNGKRRRDTKRRSSFIRGRLSQAAVSLDVSELSSCIPLEFPADQRLELLIQKVAHHTLNNLTEEFPDLEEESDVVTDALDGIQTEIGKLKEDKEFVHTTTKNSALPHPENVALNNRISHIERTIMRSKAESAEWNKLIEKHQVAADEAQRLGEEKQLLTVEESSSGTVQSSVESLRRTKLQFVTLMDRLQVIMKAVNNYNREAAGKIQKVIKENNVNLLGNNNEVDPKEIIRSCPIDENRSVVIA